MRLKNVDNSNSTKRHVKRLKRNRIEFDERSEMEIDEDYKQYLIYFAECYDSDQSSGLTEDRDDEIPDPQYEMFLEKIRADGKSYVLEIPTISVFIKYEHPDGSENECDRQTERNLMGVMNGENIQTAEGWRKSLSEYAVKNPKYLMSEPLNSFDHGKNVFSNARIGPQISGPQSTSGMEKGQEDDCDQEIQKVIRNIVGDKNEAVKDWRNKISNNPKFLRSSKVKKMKTLIADRNSDSEYIRSDFCETEGFLTPEHDREVSNNLDEDYAIYLKGLKYDGDCQYVVFESGERLNLEASDSDLDILVTDRDPFLAEGKDTPFVSSRVYASMKGDEWQDLGDSSVLGRSQFREKVISILKRPYDDVEFEKLWKDVIAQKPVQGSVELRGGRTKLFLQKRLGKSYLDHYTDLKGKLDAYRHDSYKLLNILRGFFYWIENLSQQGAFRPWLDESCLSVMPGSHWLVLPTTVGD